MSALTLRVCVFKKTRPLGKGARLLFAGARGGSGCARTKKCACAHALNVGRCMHTEHGLKEREGRGSRKASPANVREAEGVVAGRLGGNWRLRAHKWLRGRARSERRRTSTGTKGDVQSQRLNNDRALLAHSGYGCALVLSLGLLWSLPLLQPEPPPRRRAGCARAAAPRKLPRLQSAVGFS